jgi:hypothetical protein
VKQPDYIRQAIEQLNAERATIPEAFAKEAREIDAAIEGLILSSDKGAQVVALRMRKEEARTRHTAKAAAIGGRMEALTEVFNKYHQNPVPPGTIMHGIDVSVLDWETRAKILAGDLDTIALFGGKYTPKPVVEPEPAVEAEPVVEAEPAVKVDPQAAAKSKTKAPPTKVTPPGRG